MAKVSFFPLWQVETEAAAMPEVIEAGTALFSQVRSNWNGASHHVKVTNKRGKDSYTIMVGTGRYARTHAHLIEFGGGYHAAKSPTVRAARAIGAQIKWKSG